MRLLLRCLVTGHSAGRRAAGRGRTAPWPVSWLTGDGCESAVDMMQSSFRHCSRRPSTLRRPRPLDASHSSIGAGDAPIAPTWCRARAFAMHKPANILVARVGTRLANTRSYRSRSAMLPTGTTSATANPRGTRDRRPTPPRPVGRGSRAFVLQAGTVARFGTGQLSLFSCAAAPGGGGGLVCP
jgi:hypothetical protein